MFRHLIGDAIIRRLIWIWNFRRSHAVHIVRIVRIVRIVSTPTARKGGVDSPDSAFASYVDNDV